MAEFDSSIRLHCVLRPFLYESFDDIYQKLDLQADAVDAYFLTKIQGAAQKFVMSAVPAGMRQRITKWPGAHERFAGTRHRTMVRGRKSRDI